LYVGSFHDSAQQHACKGCGGKIHSSILCPKCPKVVDLFRQEELVEVQVHLEEWRECLRVRLVEGLSLHLPNMTSSPTFLMPTCSSFTWMLKSDKERVKGGQPAKFGYLPMMAVATLGALNAESFCERVLSCLKLVVSDLHMRLKPVEIRMLVMLRMNRGFMEYMRKTYEMLCIHEENA